METSSTRRQAGWLLAAIVCGLLAITGFVLGALALLYGQQAHVLVALAWFVVWVGAGTWCERRAG